ncbi:MAG: CheR family methyltransferase [Acidobacteriota bacterium]
MQASGPPMTEEEFLLLNEVITTELGISFPEHKRDILASRLRPRLRELHLPRFFDYYLHLRSDIERERARLIELVTNNETYFFRETRQMDALFGPALCELKARTSVSGRLRLLCAGCSSGEEAYTLGLYARQHAVDLAGTRLEIDAFDVDASRLSQAQAAVYGPGSFRATSEEQRSRYFTPRGIERWALKPAYREGVRFFTANIVELRSFAPAVAYDVLFCRNVLIYFSEPALHSAVEHFAAVLRPGGLLFLGAAESIIGVSSRFETVRLGPVIAYRRVGK